MAHVCLLDVLWQGRRCLQVEDLFNKQVGVQRQIVHYLIMSILLSVTQILAQHHLQ
jgi:hypothetical protein